MRTFFQIHTDQPPGDVLIFLPGQEDIETLQKSIDLYAKQLPADKQAVGISIAKMILWFSPYVSSGTYMHYVCRARPLAEQPSLQSHTTKHAEMHSRDEHRGNIHHDTRYKIRHRHGQMQRKTIPSENIWRRCAYLLPIKLPILMNAT
jgi:hypothetical protein